MTINKEKIQQAARSYVRGFKSQNAAARSLKTTSPGTFSNLLNGKWDLISPEMWLKIAREIGYPENKWQHVDTTTYLKIIEYLHEARTHHSAIAFNGLGGMGKTHAIRRYTAAHSHTIWLRCENCWSQKHMLDNIIRKLGEESKENSVIEKIEHIVKTIRERSHTLIIFDQFNSLRVKVRNLFIPLYNYTEGFCGFAFSGTNHFKKLMTRSVSYDKEGSQEVMSRMNRVIHDLPKFTHADVIQLAYSNGLEDKNTIDKIWKTCEANGKYDLRYIRHQITITRDTYH